MGLDTNHGCWHGAYSAFMRWREKLAEIAGFPSIHKMEGYTESKDALSWEPYREDALTVLLNHEDCEGEIAWQDCARLADRLEGLLPLLPEVDDDGHIGNWRSKTTKFIVGLRKAYEKQENVEFH